MKTIKELLTLLAPYQKAIVVYVVGALATLLGLVGILPEMTVEQALTIIVTGAFVYFVPNKKS